MLQGFNTGSSDDAPPLLDSTQWAKQFGAVENLVWLAIIACGLNLNPMGAIVMGVGRKTDQILALQPACNFNAGCRQIAEIVAAK